MDASGLCLWAVSVSLTHPRSGELMTLAIAEPPLFEAARAREFESWREPLIQSRVCLLLGWRPLFHHVLPVVKLALGCSSLLMRGSCACRQRSGAQPRCSKSSLSSAPARSPAGASTRAGNSWLCLWAVNVSLPHRAPGSC